jgi:hypothetical protein
MLGSSDPDGGDGIGDFEGRGFPCNIPIRILGTSAVRPKNRLTGRESAGE